MKTFPSPLFRKNVVFFKYLFQVAALVILNIAYTLPFYLDKNLYKVTNEDNSTSLVRSNSALGNSDVYQWFYKTMLFYVLMYGAPLITLAVLTGLLIRALAKARIQRQRLTGQNVSFITVFTNECFTVTLNIYSVLYRCPLMKLN